MSIKMQLTDVRIAFAADLFTAKSVNGSKPAYASSFLMAPVHPVVAQIRENFKKLANEKWGAKGPQVLTALEKTDKLCLHDGNTKTYAGYAGNLYLSARNPVRPRVVDRNKNEVASDSGIIYSGCRVVALIELWAQDNNFGKRLNATLRGVQFYADDEPFSGGGAASDDEFETLDAEATEDDSVLA